MDKQKIIKRTKYNLYLDELIEKKNIRELRRINALKSKGLQIDIASPDYNK